MLSLDGGYIVAGETQSFGDGYYDFWVLKLEADGDVEGCSIISSTSAEPATTSATVSDTSATPNDTNATVQNTEVIPSDTDATTTQECPELPDLTAYWLDLRVRGRIIQGRLRVENVGVVGAPSGVRVSFYISNDGVDLTRLIRIGRIDRSIAPGGSRGIRVVLRSPIPVRGKYVIAVVDLENRIEEINEGNNIAVCGPLP